MSIALPLASAVLGGGAVLLPAGGGLPQRISHPPTVSYDGWVNTYVGIAFAPDNLHVWTANWAASRIYKIRISDGALITTVATAANPIGLCRTVGSNSLFAATYTGSRVYEINATTGVIIQNLASPIANPSIIAQAVAGLVWIKGWAWAQPTEYTWPGLVATGRVYPDANVWNFKPATVGGTVYLFASCWSGGGFVVVKQVTEAALALTRTFPTQAAGSYMGGPGYASLGWYHFDVDETLGKLFTWDSYAGTQPGLGAVDQWDIATGAVDGRKVWPSADVGGMTYGMSYAHPGIIMDDSRTQLANTNQIGPAGSATQRVTIRNIGTSTATWTYAVPSAYTMNAICVPGNLGNSRGAEGTFLKTQCTYAINGAPAVAFTPDDQLGGVNIYPGDSLVIAVSMNTWGSPPGAVPFIGDDGGGGLSLDVDVPTAAAGRRTGYP